MKLLVALLLIFCLTAPTVAASRMRMDVVDLGVLATGRPAKINLWYPAGDCAGSAMNHCLADSAITRKVIVLLPGSMGSADEYSWLGEALADAGYIVVGMNPYGESRIYGESTREARSAGFTWHRAADVSAVLDLLQAMPLFQRNVGWDDVIAIGHSAGGQTAAMLAGVRFDLRRLVAYCASIQALGDRSCTYARDAAKAPQPFLDQFAGDYHDSRVRKLILLDPALGPALTPNSAQAVSLPVLVVGSVHNDFLSWPQHGLRYATLIPRARALPLNGQEGHFVYLAPCAHKGEINGVALCKDRPGVDRRAVQHMLLAQIIDFVRPDDERTLDGHRGNSSPVPITGNHTADLAQILAYTPRWVFGLLAALLAFGLMQKRTRRVPVTLALLLPALMPIWSLIGVLQYIEPALPSVLCWLAGLVACAVACIRWMPGNFAYREPGRRTLTIRGSWLPLLIILGIFSIRYMLGMARAIQSPWIHRLGWMLLAAFALGTMSGFFLARGLALWRVARTREPRDTVDAFHS